MQLTKDTTQHFFTNKAMFKAYISIFKNKAKLKDITSGDILLYALARGKDWTRVFAKDTKDATYWKTLRKMFWILRSQPEGALMEKEAFLNFVKVHVFRDREPLVLGRPDTDILRWGRSIQETITSGRAPYDDLPNTSQEETMTAHA